MPPSITQLKTTVRPQDYLRKVGADQRSIILGAADQITVDHFRQQIKQGKSFESPFVHYDEWGNIIDADGRHRALAHYMEKTERMSVVVKRNQAVVEKVMQSGTSNAMAHAGSGTVSKTISGARRMLGHL